MFQDILILFNIDDDLASYNGDVILIMKILLRNFFLINLLLIRWTSPIVLQYYHFINFKCREMG